MYSVNQQVYMQMEMKITVIKFETVNGKKMGRSFSFPMDPKKMAEYKTEATVRKKIEEYVVKNGPFKKEEMKDVKYQLGDFIAAWKEQVAIREQEMLEKLDASEVVPGGRVTPERITHLAPGEIFVFGSNARGLHGGGAARQAYESFGAIWGQGHGLQGKSYAIDSMSGLAALQADTEQFCEFARSHPNMRFLVTLIGCGIAGYQPSDVAPCFEACRELCNVTLPAEFWDILGEPETEDTSTKHYDLERFVTAQAMAYDTAYEEMREGRKRGHWIWYIFPQQKGLGHSYNSEYYGLDGEGEARAYLAHPILGQRLRDICEVLLEHAGKRDIDYIMGSGIDVLKLQTSMNLFNSVCPDDVFQKVLEAFF